MNPAKDSARDVVAIHEAGHAVAAVLAGGRLVSIDLRKCGKRDAATKFRLPVPRLGARQGLIRLIKIGLSGKAAEDIYLGHQRPRSVSFAEMADEENYGPGDISEAVYEARHLVDFETLCFNGSRRRNGEMQRRATLSPETLRWEPGWKEC